MDRILNRCLSFSSRNEDSIQKFCRGGDKQTAKIAQVNRKVLVDHGVGSRHLHSNGNLVESCIRFEDVLDLGENFDDVLFVSKNTDNWMEVSSVKVTKFLFIENHHPCPLTLH